MTPPAPVAGENADGGEGIGTADCPSVRKLDHVHVCDNCGRRVFVEGVNEPHFVHVHGSVFCMTARAEVNGRSTPNGSEPVS